VAHPVQHDQRRHHVPLVAAEGGQGVAPADLLGDQRQGERQPLGDAGDGRGQGGGQLGLVERDRADDPGPVEQDQRAAVPLGLVVVAARVGPLEDDHVDRGGLGRVAEPVEPLGVAVPGRQRHHQPGHDRGGGGQGGLDGAEGGRDPAVVHVHLEVDVGQLVGLAEGVRAAQPGRVDPGQRQQRPVQHLDDLLAPHGHLSGGRGRRYSLPQGQPARRHLVQRGAGTEEER
jgi:hypothetical protein